MPKKKKIKVESFTVDVSESNNTSEEQSLFLQEECICVDIFNTINESITNTHHTQLFDTEIKSFNINSLLQIIYEDLKTPLISSVNLIKNNEDMFLIWLLYIKSKKRISIETLSYIYKAHILGIKNFSQESFDEKQKSYEFNIRKVIYKTRMILQKLFGYTIKVIYNTKNNSILNCIRYYSANNDIDIRQCNKYSNGKSSYICVKSIILYIKSFFQINGLLKKLIFCKNEDINQSVIHPKKYQESFFQGSTFRNYSSKIHEYDFLFSFMMTTDGVNFVDFGYHNNASQLYPVILQCLNYYSENNNSNEQLHLYCLSSHQCLKIGLKCLIDEFIELYNGIDIQYIENDVVKSYRVKAILCGVAGYNPALSELFGFVGHNCLLSCPFCLVNRKKNLLIYHHVWNDIPVIVNNCQIEDYIPREMILCSYEIQDVEKRNNLSIEKDRKTCIQNNIAYENGVYPTHFLQYQLLPYFSIIDSYMIDPFHTIGNVVKRIIEILINAPPIEKLINNNKGCINSSLLDDNNNYPFQLDIDTLTIIRKDLKEMIYISGNGKHHFTVDCLDYDVFKQLNIIDKIYFFLFVFTPLLVQIEPQECSMISGIMMLRESIYYIMYGYRNNECTNEYNIERRLAESIYYISICLPSFLVTPHMHLLIHISDQIKKFGSFQISMCMRYERRYRDLKLASKNKKEPIVSSFLDISDQSSCSYILSTINISDKWWINDLNTNTDGNNKKTKENILKIEFKIEYSKSINAFIKNVLQRNMNDSYLQNELLDICHHKSSYSDFFNYLVEKNIIKTMKSYKVKNVVFNINNQSNNKFFMFKNKYYNFYRFGKIISIFKYVNKYFCFAFIYMCTKHTISSIYLDSIQETRIDLVAFDNILPNNILHYGRTYQLLDKRNNEAQNIYNKKYSHFGRKRKCPEEELNYGYVDVFVCLPSN
ncbi:hypothetical protein WA158_006951 [Blastocystis sp. Blastoise]